MKGTRIDIAGAVDERTTVEAVREYVPRGSWAPLVAVPAPAVHSYPYPVRVAVRTNYRRTWRKYRRRVLLYRVFGWLPFVGRRVEVAASLCWLDWRVADSARRAVREEDS